MQSPLQDYDHINKMFHMVFPTPLPHSLILGTIFATPSDSSRALDALGRQWGYTHVQRDTAANANCPAETTTAGPPPLPSRRQLLAALGAWTSAALPYRTKARLSPAVTCELRILFTGADLHFICLAILLIVCWKGDAGQKIPYKMT